MRSGTVFTSVSPKNLNLRVGFLKCRKFLITSMIELKAPAGLMSNSTIKAMKRPRIIQITDETNDCTPGFFR